jgi:hypothetical protein
MHILVLLAGTGPAAGRGSTRSAASAPHATRAPENPPMPRTARERSMCAAESNWWEWERKRRDAVFGVYI